MCKREWMLLVQAIAASGSLSSASHASYTGVTMVNHTTVSTPSGTKTVYRMYANFNSGSDRLAAWGGLPQVGGTTQLYTGPCDGTSFFQFPVSNTAPSQKAIAENPLLEWDTFATIGVSIAEQGDPYDQTLLSFSFPPFINGNSLLLTDKMVFIPNNAPQARADYAGDGDPLLRVLLMQLTVSEGEWPHGFIALQWKNAANQTISATSQLWQPLEPLGRCCTPSGECVLTSSVSCSINTNGFWIGCDPCETCEKTCVPDIAPHPGDGNVDVDDLLAVINGWGACNPFITCPADVAPGPAGNDVVDVDDLIAVINGWGPCQ